MTRHEIRRKDAERVQNVANLSNRDLIIEYFKRIKDMQEVESKSRKYITLQAGDQFFFIGRNGSVHRGKSISNSLSITYIFNKPEALERMRKELDEKLKNK